MLPHGDPTFLLLAVVAAAAVRTLGAGLAVTAGPLPVARHLRKAEVAVHNPLLGLEDAAGEEEFHAQLAAHAGAVGDEAAGGLQDVREELCALCGWRRGVEAADVGEADLAVASPGDAVVGEDRGADCRNGEGDVAHARQIGEEVADVLATFEVAWVRVVEAIAGAGRVLEDFEGEPRGFDQVEEAGDRDGADVC